MKKLFNDVDRKKNQLYIKIQGIYNTGRSNSESKNLPHLTFPKVNTAPPSQKGGNNTRHISSKGAALYINLMQAPH